MSSNKDFATTSVKLVVIYSVCFVKPQQNPVDMFAEWNLEQLATDYDIHTYIIDHYNPSVIIIDLASHTTYVVCVNFIHKWRNLQFKVDSERQDF